MTGSKKLYPTPDVRGFSNQGSMEMLAKHVPDKDEFNGMTYRAGKSKTDRIHAAMETNQNELFSQQDFHARTSQSQESSEASTVSEAVYLTKLSDSVARFIPEPDVCPSLCWRTWQHCLPGITEGGLDMFSEGFPKSGIVMRDGESNITLFRLETLADVCLPAHLTEENGCGLWRTPSSEQPGAKVDSLVCEDGTEPKPGQRLYYKESGGLAQYGLEQQVKMLPTASARDWKDSPGMSKTGTNPDGTERKRTDQLARRIYDQDNVTKEQGSLNPTWVCWLMGLPLDYLDLDGYQNPELEGLPPEYLTE